VISDTSQDGTGSGDKWRLSVDEEVIQAYWLDESDDTNSAGPVDVEKAFERCKFAKAVLCLPTNGCKWANSTFQDCRPIFRRYIPPTSSVC